MDYDPLVIRETAAVRFLRAVGLLRIEEPVEGEVTPGSDFAEGVPVNPPYDPRRAMSALVASPYFAACVLAVAGDISSLPVVVARQVKGSDGERLMPVPSHPLQALLNRPTSDPTITGRQWRKQIIADRLCAGTAGALVLYDGAQPVALQRMHPARIDLEPSSTGGIRTVGYARNMGETQQSYSPNAVLLWRDISWTDGPRSLFGIGTAQVLDRDISAEVALAESTARQAKKGRPDAVYAPKGDASWSTPQVTRMRAEVQRMIQSADGGVAVLSGVGELKPLGWAPKDMANAEQRKEIRDACMALLGVPPIRLGLETANYATAREQLRVYWMGLQALSAEIDEQFQRVADMFGEGLVVFTDFSGVAALQEDETARLQRVNQHIVNGMSPADAYAYEGFEDAPFVADVAEVEQAPNEKAAPPVDLDALADIIAQARAVRSGDVDDEDVAIEAATLADMVLATLSGLAAPQPAEAR